MREFETADGRRGRRRIPVLAPFEFFASSRLIRAQFHREGAKCAKGPRRFYWLRLGCTVKFAATFSRWLGVSVAGINREVAN